MFKGILAGVVGVGLIIGGTFFFGNVDNLYLKTVQKDRENIKTEIFQESKSYVEGMISDLSDYKREFERTTDVNEKEQIANMIDAEFANFDINKIDNSNLYNFLIEIRNGDWK